jgi:hypothetical protein
MTARGLTYAELATGFAKTYTTTQIEIVLSESGKSAYELAVENGFVGTTIEWLASLVGTSGADGLSAYEIAVENGFIGNEAAWLESLQGTDGSGAAAVDTLTDVTISGLVNGQYLKYDLNALKWKNTTPEFFCYGFNVSTYTSSLFMNQTFFALMDSNNFNASPTIAINSANALSLSTGGTIIGLKADKHYTVDMTYIRHSTTGSTNLTKCNIGLYSGNVETGSLIGGSLSIGSFASLNAVHPYRNIITGYTSICPVLKYNGAAYVDASYFDDTFSISVREL